MAEDVPEGINEDTVQTLLEEVREQVKLEDAREQSFNARGVGLAGFAGVIVALTTGLGKLAVDSDPSCLATVLGAIAFGGTIIALLFSLGFVLKVLLPQESSAISIKRIESYPNWRYISKPEVMVQGEILRGWITALAKDRQRNSSKARWLRRSYIALSVGIIFLVLLAGILGVDTA